MAQPALPELLRDVMIELVRRDDRDLTARQVAILLLCRARVSDWRVRALAERLDAPKPAVTRAVDRLVVLGLAMRVNDPADGRGVIVALTTAGRRYVETIDRLAALASRRAGTPLRDQYDVG